MALTNTATESRPASQSTDAERLPMLAFVTDEASEATLRAGLAEGMDGVTVRRGGVRAAIRQLEKERTPRILIVDLSGEEDCHGALDALAAVCEPDVLVLAMGEQGDIAFYRELTRDLGVAEYITKPLTRDNVTRLFGARIAGATGDRSRRSGQIVTVCGMRGGVGATTIAINLALQLSEATRSYVGLLDLHLRGGTTAMMLGVRPTAGLRVALEEPDRIDGLFLDRISVPVSERLRLYAADEPPDADLNPKAEGAVRLLEMLRTRSNIIVVDLPYPPGPVERRVLALARQRVLVLEPDVAGVRDTVAARRMLTAMAVSGPVFTVLNREGAPGALDTALVREGIGSAPDFVIPDLPKQLPRAANLGQPAVRESAALRRALAPLVQEIAATRAVEAETSMLGRLRAMFSR